MIQLVQKEQVQECIVEASVDVPVPRAMGRTIEVMEHSPQEQS